MHSVEVSEKNVAFSRRSALSVLTALPSIAVVITSAEACFVDLPLLTLGRDFDTLAAKLDHAIATGVDFDDELPERLSQIEAEIARTHASTMEGLCVKARAACWALLGDLNDPADATTDERMALSIVRDLIRLYHPALEQPGALQQLVKDVENAARNSAGEQ